MGFSGTQDKCKACDKTVHLIELVSADGVPYHKTCFKCSHCNGKLVISSFSSMDGALYCKPHFEQLFKETGSYSKKFHQCEISSTPSKLSHRFSGTQDKCALCLKTAYPIEKLTVEGESYHKSCFRCSHGGCFLTPSTYAALDGILYCKPHFSQLFKEKGSYNHLNKIASMKRDAALPLAQPKEQAGAPNQGPPKAPESGPEDKPKSEQKQ
ncbi:hypothetical protein EUGRSUZ_D01873 [Eucalyptus grandis]|uniref:Uncharacterized protein n=2 Tax=Eucalyptus grandis TaxID=71139 RepID=A0ACC3L6R5_EUCGR|nr:hypothetical protein EUGRSUZ_D01873 [Eucalyptus grandis]